MPIHAVGGDIVDVGSRVAEASAIWLRSGFNERFLTWERFVGRYGPQLLGDRPWCNPDPRLITLPAADGDLHHLYFFPNPGDGIGCQNVAEVEARTDECLSLLVARGVHRIAMILIPLADQSTKIERGAARARDLVSARAMINAIRFWEGRHQVTVVDVYLVDLRNDFSTLL